MTDTFKYNVFISYNSKDKAKALKIAKGLNPPYRELIMSLSMDCIISPLE